MIRVILVDDHSVVRSGFEMILNKQIDIEVIATSGDIQEAFLLVAKHNPDILLTDISMPPGQGGISLSSRVAENYPQVKIIALTMYDTQEYLSRMLKLGARGYVLKNSSDEELIKAIRTVHAGSVHIDPLMLPGFVDAFQKATTDSTDTQYSSLTEREQEILSLIAHGYSNKEIAERLFLSVKTVEGQKTRIMKKIGVSSRPELVDYALRNDILK